MTEAAGGRRQAAGTVVEARFIAPASAGDAAPIWSISPQPDEDELAVLAVALEALTEADASRHPAAAAALPRWAQAGRQAAVLGLRGGPRTGWGRKLGPAVAG